MRLFVAVRPPADVVAALAALPRPAEAGVRWTTRDQWHVTLRFFGDVDDPAPVVASLSHVLRGARSIDVTIGPTARLLNKRVVQLPVDGLDAIATSIATATAHLGDPAPTRRFRGHLTLARTKGQRIALDELALDRRWTVHDIELIRSHLHSDGARYETLAHFALGH